MTDESHDREKRRYDDEDDESGALARYLPFVIFGAILVAIGIGGYLFLGNMGSAPPPPPELPEIEVFIPPPPPEPPPPPPEPPPPEEEPEELDEPEPEPEPEPEAIDEADSDEPPPDPGADIGTAQGTGGLAIGGGGGRGGGGDPKKYWAGQIARDIERVLSTSDEYRERSYELRLKLWVNQTGRLDDVSIEKGSGDRAFDNRLKGYLLKNYRRPNAPPDSMQPVLIRIRAKI